MIEAPFAKWRWELQSLECKSRQPRPAHRSLIAHHRGQAVQAQRLVSDIASGSFGHHRFHGDCTIVQPFRTLQSIRDCSSAPKADFANLDRQIDKRT